MNDVRYKKDSEQKAKNHKTFPEDPWQEKAESWRKKGEKFCVISECSVQDADSPKTDKQRM